MDAANGSQILVSAATREVLGGELPGSGDFIDLGVHELRDVIEPVRLYRIDSADFDSDPRPPRSGTVRSGNLPTPAGALLGRSDDVESVVADLELARVVTLTGVGGIGKTRLAVEVGSQVRAAWPDGVWFAALETVTGPDEMLRSLLSVLSIETGRGSDLESLVEGLRDREAMLVLDNCEHVLDAVATVAKEVTSSCPAVRILATSREPLDIEGERTRRVRPLPTDHEGPAFELFRLRAAEGGTVIDLERDSDAILRICRRLDGIPLAIELAAARTRSLRPSDVADRLDDMFRLLTGGRRASTDRHRTLRATLEWSHGLLEEAERAVLARLSVFAGSFSLAAAEAVAQEHGAGPGETIDVLDRLVTRSLVVPIEHGDVSRFRLLEPVRQLAAEKLVERGEADDARERHTQWYFELMDDLGTRWRAGDDQGTWPTAASELADLRAAFDHLIDSGRVDDAQRFVVDAYGPIACHFDVAPMYEWAPRALRVEPDRVGRFTASACAIAAAGAIPREDLEASAAWLRRGAEAIAAGSQDDGLVAAIAIHHVLSGGEPAVSDEFLDRSLRTALDSGDLHRQVWVLTYAGRFAEAVECARQLGNKVLIAMAQSWVAALSTEGRDEARELFWEAAQESHSYLMRNHAAMELGIEQIRAGAPLDGLLLLRSPARDWLLRGDGRVWSVLHGMAIGFATTGDVDVAGRLAGAIGDRPLPFVGPRRRSMLRTLLDDVVDEDERTRYARAGHPLAAGPALSEALERIDLIASRQAAADVGATFDSDGLTARQHEVAELVARGLSNKQIAQRLGISRYTAETHVRNILERLGAASRSEIATWISRQPSLK
jgi:predicted ATPase/DNA-binding CsgD family transcriptional regulator